MQPPSRHLAAAALAILAAAPVDASDHLGRDTLRGSWGSDRQCARLPLLEGGTRTAEPFEIDGDWLRHGSTWCRLLWFEPSVRENELYIAATALCGEDSVQSYGLAFHYTALPRPALTLLWNQRHTNGPLRRCAASE